uniref:ribosomal protein S9 n=1 Tax=Meringosphaera mediterranea TaxID=2837474 RepID=UPI00286CB302|nr:ribosomal protein S9 [Meringosphaera mediterranea]WLD05711.1 ribosomal protein S9 [Meringosphaera mediterranea]WLD05879.1 ribosomal protein S9 [Meringosphaera mediterranea]WLD06099.1 ribosomal protein S9 [Meringosphaera mediterranea]
MNQENNTFYGIGRRKQATAQVLLKVGTGKLMINGKPGELYLQENTLYLNKVNNPFEVLGIENEYDVNVKAQGGGLTGQTDAIALGIARALTELNPENRTNLKSAGLLTRDARIKERKKYGLKKARKASQFSKR